MSLRFLNLWQTVLAPTILAARIVPVSMLTNSYIVGCFRLGGSAHRTGNHGRNVGKSHGEGMNDAMIVEYEVIWVVVFVANAMIMLK